MTYKTFLFLWAVMLDMDSQDKFKGIWPWTLGWETIVTRSRLEHAHAGMVVDVERDETHTHKFT
jgi:hypothetical protein